MREILDFLTSLRNNNNREWFNSNKDKYMAIQSKTNRLTEELIAQLSTIDSSASHLSVKDCTYRIYRDIRFSADKSPFKTHIGIFINPPYGKRINTGGYYLHIEPGNSMICAGTVALDTKVVKALRQAIYDNIEEYRAIVESAEFKLCYDKLGLNPLKTAPKGFRKDWEHIDYLRPRDFIAYRELSDNFICNNNLPKILHEYFVQAKRFNDFINFTIEDFIPTTNF